MQLRQIFFSQVTFLSTSEVSIVFSITFSHANTNLLNRRFSHEQALHPLLYSESQVRRFHIQSSLQELQSSNSLHSLRHSS